MTPDEVEKMKADPVFFLETVFDVKLTDMQKELLRNMAEQRRHASSVLGDYKIPAQRQWPKEVLGTFIDLEPMKINMIQKPKTIYKLMGHTITQGESFEKEVNRFGQTRTESAQWWDIFDPQGVKLDTQISTLLEAKEFVRKRKAVKS